MKILVSMPNDGQSNHYITNALQDLGHDVFFVDHRNHYKMCLENVPAFLVNEKIDVMLVLFFAKERTYPEEYLAMLKTRYPHVKFISWIFDATIDGQYCDENERFVKLMKEYDYFFTVCRGQVESFRKQGVNAFHAPEGACSYTPNFYGEYRFEYDVSFIGQVGHSEVHTDRVPLMKAIAERFPKTIIYGPLYTNDPEIVAIHSRRPTFNDIEHSKVVSKSKINIAHSGWPHIEGYFSARVYRIMASGGFVLHNKTNNIESYFDVDKEIVLYKDTEECIRKIKHYIENNSQRHEIAKRGFKKVSECYLFTNSMSTIFDIIR